jgi:hypothetical protein
MAGVALQDGYAPPLRSRLDPQRRRSLQGRAQNAHLVLLPH